MRALGQPKRYRNWEGGLPRCHTACTGEWASPRCPVHLLVDIVRIHCFAALLDLLLVLGREVFADRDNRRLGKQHLQVRHFNSRPVLLQRLFLAPSLWKSMNTSCLAEL